MDERNWVIADIPVRKGLEERYWVHIINVANVILVLLQDALWCQPV